jgi:hypothetical protein
MTHGPPPAMNLSRADALRAYARALHHLSVSPIEPWLAEHVRFASQWAFAELVGKTSCLTYFAATLERIRRSGLRVWAEMGELTWPPRSPCLILSRGTRDNRVATALVEVQEGLIHRVDLCDTPSPALARGFGEFPA